MAKRSKKNNLFKKKIGQKNKKNTGIDKKAWVVVLGVLIGITIVFMISSNFTNDKNITGYTSDNPFGITGGTIDNLDVNGSIYGIVGIFIVILLFYLVRRIAKNN